MGKDEFGDFQTPPALAVRVHRLLRRRGIEGAAILEPSCGLGSLLIAGSEAFPRAKLRGVDINPDYVSRTAARLPGADVRVGDIFHEDWEAVLRDLPGPLLVVGNPPWVTNADLSRSANLPKKVNYAGLSGMDARTGKGNFDLSEWLLIRLAEAALAIGAVGHLAFLVKTAVARKFLAYAWGRALRVDEIATWGIDAQAEFGAAVDACLLVFRFGVGASVRCDTFAGMGDDSAGTSFGFVNGRLVADLDAWPAAERVQGVSRLAWRSGIKHDCAKVMQLRRVGDDRYTNGLGEEVGLEPELVFPMHKSSEVAAEKPAAPVHYMLVPQRRVGEDTSTIAARAPKTWAYLRSHHERLAARGSSIYQNTVPYAIFGVGDYTFAPWKVAISGMYKRVVFRVVGPHEGRPVVFDDTVYLVGCGSREEAEDVAALVSGPAAAAFFRAFVFWDAKRPITADLLNRLDLDKLGGLRREMDAAPDCEQLFTL